MARMARRLADLADPNINAIPNNMEKYMAFTLGNNLKFIDSFNS